MTFKTRPNSYSIGLAPTNGARCRRCHAGVQSHLLSISGHLLSTIFWLYSGYIHEEYSRL